MKHEQKEIRSAERIEAYKNMSDESNWIYAINNIKTDGVACGFRGTLEEPAEH